MRLYCLSGLGVDERVFNELELKGWEIVCIPWIEIRKNESLRNYSERLFKTVDFPENYHLLGLSFGGMIAQEFVQIRPPKTLILISTTTSNRGIQKFLRFLGRNKIHYLVPGFVLKSTTFISNYLFGVKSITDKELLARILKDSTTLYLKRAISAIMKWPGTNTTALKGIWIHGENDKLIPAKARYDYKINDAGHFMIMTHAAKISEIINAIQ